MIYYSTQRRNNLSKNKWIEKWEAPTHVNAKREIFKLVDNYLDTPPKRILDIGCGLATESEFFQKKYNCELYLLDGDFDNNKNNRRDIKFGKVENFKFYSKVDDLKQSWNSRNMSYTFVDASNIDIPDDIIFDLVYSGVSCGFHYPADTYKNLIVKHTNKDSKILFDLRNYVDQTGFEIIDIVKNYKKHTKANIRFI